MTRATLRILAPGIVIRHLGAIGETRALQKTAQLGAVVETP